METKGIVQKYAKTRRCKLYNPDIDHIFMMSPIISPSADNFEFSCPNEVHKWQELISDDGNGNSAWNMTNDVVKCTGLNAGNGKNI